MNEIYSPIIVSIGNYYYTVTFDSKYKADRSEYVIAALTRLHYDSIENKGHSFVYNIKDYNRFIEEQIIRYVEYVHDIYEVIRDRKPSRFFPSSGTNFSYRVDSETSYTYRFLDGNIEIGLLFIDHDDKTYWFISWDDYIYLLAKRILIKL